MADKESTLVFKVDGTQAEAGVAKVKRSLNDLADTASREGQRGAAGIAGMGAGAEKSAAQIERATQRQIGEIRRMTAELDSGGKATRAYQEAMASIRGVDVSALRPYLDQLEQARTRMAGLGTTAAQTANQMRMVAPQITDIVTQLASGQSAFTIFIQQGGQLKDMFGGVGNAAKAIGTYVLGLINPFTLAAGAAALLATAYYQGSKESEAYSKAIVLSGNAAGVTAGQLGDMARAMETSTRTQSAAAAAIAEMAQNSRVGSDELQRYTAIAMDFEKVTGTAVSKTAEAFASLAKEPLQAAIKLNDGVNWLTTSTYEHVKSLEEQGRKTDAARVAQEAYANSVAQKTAQLQGNLGALERGWNALAGAAKWAWDAMLNIGRKETLGEQLESARKQLEDAERQAITRSAGSFGAFQAGQEPDNRAAIDALKQKIALLSEQERMLKRGAEAQAAANAQVQARIELDSKYGDRLKTDAQKAKAARDEIAELGKAAGKSAEEIKRLQDASDKTFEKKGGGSKRTSAAPGENEIARIKAMIEEEQRYITALQERGKEAEKLTAGEKLVLKLQQELQTSMSGVAKANKEKALAVAQELVSVEKVRVAEEKRIKSDEENRKRLIASIDEERAARMKLAEESAKRVDSIGKENDRMREEIETMGLSAAQIAARTIEVNNATIAEKENQLARLKNDSISTREMAALEEEIRLLKERNGLIGQRSEKNEMLEAQRAQLDMWKSIDQTAHDVFVNIFEDGAGTFKRLGQTLKAALLDMLYQMTVKRWIIQIGASFTGQPLSVVSQALGGGQGGAGGILGGATNGNSILNFGSLISNWMGAGSGAAAGTLAYGNMIGALGGDGLGAFIAANGGWGTSGFGAVGSSLGGIGGSAVGLGVVAAPLVIGALAERNSRDRYGGAAYATSDWRNDPLAATIGADFDGTTGSLPDRAALEARARQAGIADATMALFGGNDRAFLHYVRLAEGGGIGDNGLLPDPRKLIEQSNLYGADFYRGAGYASPQAMGWWNDKHGDLLSNDPKVAAASRALSESIVAPLTDLARMMGDEADLRVTTGFANRGEGAMWGAARIERGGQTIVDMERGDYADAQQYMRAVYRESLEAFDDLNLPKWAQGQVDGAQAAMDKLTGDNVGEQAAALFTQATAGIEQMYRSIQMLIDVFPDFSAATQDSVYSLAELMGGMDNLQSAYSTYIGAFWTEQERAALATAQLTAQLADLGQTMPTTREEFRAMVEQALAAGEEGNALAAALLGMSGAMAEVLPQIDAITTVAFEASGELAGLIKDGLLGTFDGNNLGAAMAATVQNGVYNAIAGGFAQQITDIIVQGVINPVIQAAMTGSSVSAAVSAASIDAMVAQAQAVAQAAAAILTDPAFVAAMAQITDAVGSITVPSVGYAAPAVISYSDAVTDSGAAARDATASIADAWRTLLDEVDEIARMTADAVRDLRGEVDTTRQQAAAGANAYIEQALADMRATGALPDAEGLRKAIDDARAGLRAEDYASMSDFRRDQLILAGKLEEISGVAGRQKSYAEQQIDLLSEGNDLQRQQLDELRRVMQAGGPVGGGAGAGMFALVPGFAAGGLHAGGLRVVGENGPELEMTGPARYWSFQQSRAMLGGAGDSESAAETRALRAEVERLNALVRRLVDLSQSTNAMIDQVTAGGDAVQVTGKVRTEAA